MEIYCWVQTQGKSPSAPPKKDLKNGFCCKIYNGENNKFSAFGEDSISILYYKKIIRGDEKEPWAGHKYHKFPVIKNGEVSYYSCDQQGEVGGFLRPVLFDAGF